MKSAGIIAEYNPFHQGHIHHLKMARQTSNADCVIVLVSDYFSQRGLPSLLTPYDKAKLALENGADLVIGLPAVYASQSADWFARYALEALSVLGVDEIVFGSESNDPAMLEGMLASPPVSIDPSLSQARNNPALPANDMLGLQYIANCRDLGIGYRTIQRDDSFKSATATRKDFFSGKKQFLQEYFQACENWEHYYPFLRLALVTASAARLASLFLVTEGIEYRLQKNARTCKTWNEFLEASISRTYSRARIQRTCLMILLQVEKGWMKEHAHFFYGLVLGMNETGRQYLKEHPDERILSRPSEYPGWLKDLQFKTRFLYESVLDHPVRTGIVYEKQK